MCILLATDAAAEGVNLPNHCSRLIHYEIPWNPNRMEQCNGRMDPHGQKAAVTQIFHVVGQGFDTARPTEKVGELEADLEFLTRAALKGETIREDLGKVGLVIAAQVEARCWARRCGWIPIPTQALDQALVVGLCPARRDPWLCQLICRAVVGGSHGPARVCDVAGAAALFWRGRPITVRRLMIAGRAARALRHLQALPDLRRVEKRVVSLIFRDKFGLTRE